MGLEIERKFLVIGEGWRSEHPGIPMIQGYLLASTQATIRVRIAHQQAYLTLKSKVEHLTRQEFEYAIPLEDAQAILSLCDLGVVSKTRYKIALDDLVWEVDEFASANQGLLLAEVELSSPDQSVSLPDWIGEEVSYDPRYFNSYLAQHPYSTWPPVCQS
ncbi:MAG: CYTH domain-containing protein [Acaryochloridaceae cyanobacterium SU_2_1]|nr:CYTH domain-containing protein [Acaryochloridaceae cyanobacterium SU_2_1]